MTVLSEKSHATHSAGSDLTYQCLGNGNYRVQVSFYRDCAGIAAPFNIPVIYRSASCGYNLSAPAVPVAGTGQEITLPCLAAATTCNTGTLTGIQKFVYEVIIKLPTACEDWIFSYQVCCRNCAITTAQNPCGAGSNLYVEAFLNNVAAPCNNSPYFNNDPVLFACTDQPFNYNPGIMETDGDSLAYELIAPKTGASTEISFIPPYNPATPIKSKTPIEFDPVTGQIQFTPELIQIGILTYRISEYRDGLLIGSTMRDMQLYSSICSNSLPFATGIDGTNDFTVETGPADTLDFTVHTMDSDVTQQVHVDIINGVPGALLLANNNSHPDVSFSWIPDSTHVRGQPYVFYIEVRDDACPLNGKQVFAYSVYVKETSVTIQSTDVTCNGYSNGSAQIVNSLPGSSFLWNTGATTSFITGLDTGTYTANVWINGTTSIFTTIVKEPSPLAAAIAVTSHVGCYDGNNGMLYCTAAGGTPPHAYAWNTGATTKDLKDVPAGVYTVIVTDANGCTTSQSAIITQPSGALATTLSVAQSISCHGGNNGAISLAVSNGTPPYTYQWSHGATTQQATGLLSGTYTVLVTDANGCTFTDSAQVAQPAGALNINANVSQHVNCYGGNDGSINLNVSLGTPPYTFVWSNGAITHNLNGVPAGNYSVVVTDANGCTAQTTVSVTQPAAFLALTGVATAFNCLNHSGGTVNISPSGGTTPYTFLWSNGTTTQNLTGAVQGIYTVTATDMNGCTAESQYTITENSTFQVQANGPTTLCVGELVTLVADSINGATYQWFLNGQTLGGATYNTFVAPAAGHYSVSIAHACGAFHSDTIKVAIHSIDNVSLSPNVIICPGESTQLNVTGGTSYKWSPAKGLDFTSAPNPIARPEQTTTYTVEITNEQGCKTTGEILVTVLCDTLIIPSGYSPNDDGVNDGFVIKGIEQYPGNRIWIYNRWGNLIFKTSNYRNQWDGISNISGIYNGKRVPNGTYYYVLDLNEGGMPRTGYVVIRK